MGDVKRHLGLMMRAILLAAATCLASGAALATCTVSGSGAVPCYIKVQPIDVCATVGGTPSCAPFNTTSQNGNPATAGMPFQSLPTGFVPPTPITGIPNNPSSANPIGFTVDPKQAITNPGTSAGVDITRELLNNIGVELVWLPMNVWNSPPNTNYLTLNINPGPTTTQVASCTGFISGTTLTITAAGCSTGALMVDDFLSWSAGKSWSASPNPPTTFISALVGGSGGGTGGVGTYTVFPSLTTAVGSSKTPITITAYSSTLVSTDLLNLSQQVPTTSTLVPPNPPCAISQMTIPPTSPCFGPSYPLGGTSTSSAALSGDPGTINVFFVNTLNPPAAAGTLYGFSNFCNNGVAIGSNTFFAPSPLDARPDTIAHELLHNLCLDHVSYGAGPWTPPNNGTSYTAPAGVTGPFPAKPAAGECDPSYPACAANLMTTGSLRTTPTVACALAGIAGDAVPSACIVSGAQLPGLFNSNINLMADQVTPLPSPFSAVDSTKLPTTQDMQVLNGGSGLLNNNNPALMFSGLVDPIPRETTKAQLGTGGSSAGQAVFDLSGPTEGKGGETLVAWVLTLPEGQTFAKDGEVNILSASREDLVRSIKYYPEFRNNPLRRDIAYDPGADNDPSMGMAGPSPCASGAVQCLVVKFQPPGLGAPDSISFSKSVLNGDTPITNDDLCKAKITYIFSDGFVTTSNFGQRCPAASLPLIASSWYPDPHVAPQIIKINQTDLLLASTGPGQAGGLIGHAYLNNPASTNAVIGFSHGLPDVTFSVPPGSNPTCVIGTLCFDSRAAANGYTVGGFLTTGGATILSGAANAPAGLNNTVLEFTGLITVTTGQQFTITQDDGLSLQIGSTLVYSFPGPISPTNTSVTYNGPSGTFPFDLVYGECCGAPAVLDVSLKLYPTLPCTPIQGSDPPACMDTTTTPTTDATIYQEVQPGQTCDNGATHGTINVGGIIVGPVGGLQVNAGQTCNYSVAFDPPCEIVGNLTINGGSVYLNCQLDGNLTVNSGLLTIGELALVKGNVTIMQSPGSAFANGFRIGNSNSPNQAQITGNLTIQNLLPSPRPPATPTIVPTGGSVCNTVVSGGISVQNTTTQSAIEIGDPAKDPTCQVNTIGGNLLCATSTIVPPVQSGGNIVGGGKNTCG